MQTVSLPDAIYRAAQDLAGGGPVEAVIAEAVEDLRRKRWLADLNADFASLRANPDAWAAEEAERREWDATLGDGIEIESE